jgi:hypothetical protein
MYYVPTTWPGARLPHVWLSDGRAVQDHIGYGHGYSLLRLGAAPADAAALARAFATIGAPLQVLDIPDERARDLYGYDLLLLRPDLHIVWRGHAAPQEPDKLAALATGQ